MKKIKCDRKHCAGKTFRGKHECLGYSYFPMMFGNKNQYMICPCSCHKGIREIETWRKIKENEKIS